jgi:ABC-type Zn uptake system ZnuABC Zn-binding protein ZnuA
MSRSLILKGLLTFLVLLSACQSGLANSMDIASTPMDLTVSPGGSELRVLAVETFLADIAQNVAGNRLIVESLIPYGIDPHSIELTPQDVVKIAESDVLISNGSGFEGWLEDVLRNAAMPADKSPLFIEASAGLTSRKPDESVQPEGEDEHGDVDPHYWLDPNMVIQYVKNIQAGLVKAYPGGEVEFADNAHAYIEELGQLDTWIQETVSQIPPERRKFVTNHESFGYFADRYGFQIIGTIIPSVTTSASPSARQLTNLVQLIREHQVKAIFLETGSNPELADQLARETGIQIVTGLYTHSITPPEGEAPTYIEMMKHNVRTIVAALQ